MTGTIVSRLAKNKPKLLDQVRDAIRVKHYSIRTEQAYVDWIKRFILYHGKRHPAEMAEEEVAQFLTYLAGDLDVASSTQNQALSALLFLYKNVLKHEIGWLEKVERAKKPAKLPVVLSRAEVKQIFAQLHGVPKIMAGAALWQRAALDGVRSSAGERHRFRTWSNHRARRKGRQRSYHDAAVESGRTTASTSGASQGAARAGSHRWIRQRPSSVRAESKISERDAGMGVAICVCVIADFDRPPQRSKTAPSHR